MKIFLTEYPKGGLTFCGRVEAENWQEAELAITHKGEKVVGELVEEIEICQN
jgi:hypothetical protein